MSVLVTTPALIRVGLHSKKIGTKVPFRTFRDGKPIQEKQGKKRVRDDTPDVNLGEGIIWARPAPLRARLLTNDALPFLYSSFAISLYICYNPGSYSSI